jgi:hypothetical protein
MSSTVELSGVSVSAATLAESQIGNGTSNLRLQAGDENIPGEEGPALFTPLDTPEHEENGSELVATFRKISTSCSRSCVQAKVIGSARY